MIWKSASSVNNTQVQNFEVGSRETSLESPRSKGHLCRSLWFTGARIVRPVSRGSLCRTLLLLRPSCHPHIVRNIQQVYLGSIACYNARSLPSGNSSYPQHYSPCLSKMKIDLPVLMVSCLFDKRRSQRRVEGDILEMSFPRCGGSRAFRNLLPRQLSFRARHGYDDLRSVSSIPSCAGVFSGRRTNGYISRPAVLLFCIDLVSHLVALS